MQLRSLILLLILLLTACSALQNGNGGYYPDSPYYDDRYDDRYEDRDSYHHARDRERWKRERREREYERERRERERREHQHAAPVETNQQKLPERCPSGFRPSERKCSDKERRKGCKDMRTGSGLGCVSSRFR